MPCTVLYFVQMTRCKNLLHSISYKHFWLECCCVLTHMTQEFSCISAPTSRLIMDRQRMFWFWNCNIWRAWFVSIAEIGKSGPYTTPQPLYNNRFVPSHYPADPATTKDMQGDDFSDEKLRENTNCTITIYTNEKTRAIGFVSEWLNAYEFLSRK